jgi:hypothetical protein
MATSETLETKTEVAETLFRQGIEYEKKKLDLNNAMKMYHAAAELGHVLAHYYIGVSFAKGEGSPLDQKKAVEWYEKGFALGSIESARALGNRYFYGSFETKINYPKAMFYYKIAGPEYFDMYIHYVFGVWLGLTDIKWQEQPNVHKAWEMVKKLEIESQPTPTIFPKYVASQIACSIYWNLKNKVNVKEAYDLKH